MTRLVLLAAAAAATLAWSGAATRHAQAPADTLVVSNEDDHTATLLDAATGGVLATPPADEGPHDLASPPIPLTIAAAEAEGAAFPRGAVADAARAVMIASYPYPFQGDEDL